MTNEKRIVDYREMKKLFGERYREIKKLIEEGETHLDRLAEGFTEADHLIRDLPAVDAVEVVRCKDCKMWRGNDYDGCCIKNGLATRMANDFCSYGERKEARE